MSQVEIRQSLIHAQSDVARPVGRCGGNASYEETVKVVVST